MKKLLISSLLGLGLSVVSSYGSMLFDYSYTFSDGTAITGTLKGDAAGDYVTSVSDVTLSINGTPEGNLLLLTANPFAGAGPITVSFKKALNNFIFFSGDTGDAFGLAPVSLDPSVASPEAAYSFNGDVLNETQIASWSLTAVPEPTTMVAGSLLLLPFALSTVRILRKNRMA